MLISSNLEFNIYDFATICFRTNVQPRSFLRYVTFSLFKILALFIGFLTSMAQFKKCTNRRSCFGSVKSILKATSLRGVILLMSTKLIFLFNIYYSVAYLWIYAIFLKVYLHQHLEIETIDTYQTLNYVLRKRFIC